MKKILRSIFERTINKPIYVKYCSQSIYRPLLGCLLLWDATNDNIWRKRSKKLSDLLIHIQRPDGGFDNGYDYNFGLFHKKGESIAPELVGLVALINYYKKFGGENVAVAAKLAADWIKRNAIQLTDDKWAIPYAPYSINDVMVYNGTSFASGALGVYLSVFPDIELETMYHGMNKYIYSVLSSNIDQPGKFWHYSDQSRTDLTDIQRDKIDYYHQMQQVEMHTEAQLCFNSPFQKDMINLATEHVAFKQNDSGTIPYLNSKMPIHLWGYCSCASGFIMAGKIVKDKKTEYTERAAKIFEWILNNSWNGDYFYPIVSEDGKIIDKRFYVRSDAWVFNSFALAVKEGINTEKYLEVCEKSYHKMEEVDFSGIENHVSTRRNRLVINFIQKVSKIKNRIWLK